MFFETFIFSFVLIFFLEFGDKTQLLVLALTARFSSQKFAIILGFASAITLVTFLGASIGLSLKTTLPIDILPVASALLFIIIGLYSFYELWEKKEPKKKSLNNLDTNEPLKLNSTFKGVFFKTAAIIISAELADKTQVAVILMASQNAEILAITSGAVLAMSILAVLAILAGKILTEIISEYLINLISGIIFILAGIFILLEQII